MNINLREQTIKWSEESMNERKRGYRINLEHILKLFFNWKAVVIDTMYDNNQIPIQVT